MGVAKNRALDVLSQRFDQNVPAMWKPLEDEGSMSRDEVLTARENMESISALYEHVSKMPVWPFNTATLVRLGGFVLLVVLPMVIDKLSS